MVSFSTGVLPDGVTSKRSLENGHVPKYKPRKVSAKRDFPPGCGSNAMPISLKPDANGSSRVFQQANGFSPEIINDSVVNGVENPIITNDSVPKGVGISAVSIVAQPNCVGISRMTNPAEAVEVGISDANNSMDSNDGVKAAETHPELSRLGSSVLGNFVGSSCTKNLNIEVEGPSHETKDTPEDEGMMLKQVMRIFSESLDSVARSVMEFGPVEIQQSEKVDCLTQDTVDNSINAEQAASLDTLTGQVTVTATDALMNNIELTGAGLHSLKSDSLDAVTRSGVRAISEELNEVESLGLSPDSGQQVAKAIPAGASADAVILPARSQSSQLFSRSVKPGPSTIPKDKYRRRRVSAVRQFPPHCGCNVPLQTKEKEPDASVNDSLNKTEKIDPESEVAMFRNGSVGRPSVGLLTTGPEESLNLFDIHVRRETREAPTGAAERGSLEENLVGTTHRIASDETSASSRDIVLMDFGECNRHQQDGIPEKAESKQVVSFPETIIKAEVEENTEDALRPVGKEIVTYSPDKELHREVLHGLIAAPDSPFRKRKANFKSSDDGQSGGEVRQSPQQKFKYVALNNCSKADSGPSLKKTAFPVSCDADGRSDSLTFSDEETHGPYDEFPLEITPVSMCKPMFDDDKASSEPMEKEIVVYSPLRSDDIQPLRSVESCEDKVVVQGLMAAPNCPWRKGKAVAKNSDGGRSGEKSKGNPSWRNKGKAVARKSNPKLVSSEGPYLKKQPFHHHNASESPSASIPAGEEGYDPAENLPTDSLSRRKRHKFAVNLPPFGPNNPHHDDARNKVRETLRFFHTICRKLLQKEEANSAPEEDRSDEPKKKANRIDLEAAKVIKAKGKEVNTEKQWLGQVPGVEVGDEFQYRVELALVGIHRLYQGGIDSMKVKANYVATSIVASGGYDDDTELADVLIYTGQGGGVVGKSKKPEDQKLEKGNLALKNCIETKSPVRVVRGWKEKLVDPLDPRPKTVSIYIYDGLYTVTDYWTEELKPHGNLCYKFKLVRNSGQPELAWKELKKSGTSITRPGMCVADISGGKERSPICAVNTLDDEKPPRFNYIAEIMYPNWYTPNHPQGCDCIGRCSDSKRCRCAVRNGGEIPYNRNGAIVEAKSLVYECGPHCKCPPSCYNRVSQRGIRFKLEIFKTESRGWGVRSLNSIPSGSFICEYVGELLEDKEAEERIGNDEYLFDIGYNYSDSSLRPEEQAITVEENEVGGYTIDAAQYGNIGRFINHSCSPNLYAQNVIYDHDDKRMPHVMLFAAENIPPLQELTYHYNYTLDQVRDLHGNIKIKKCFCGSAECVGRMY